MPFSPLFPEFRTGKVVRLQEALSQLSLDLLQSAKIELRGPQEAQRLADSIEDHPAAFSVLGLIGSGIWTHEGLRREDWLSLMTRLQVHRQLRVLCLKGNTLNDAGIDLVAEVLAQSQSLTYLDVSETRFRVLGAKALGGALAKNKSLLHLCVAGNPFKDSGLTHFGKGFSENDSCTTFDASGTEISVGGFHLFTEALPRNRALTSLDFSGNQYLENGAADIFYALKNSSIEVLLLGSCSIPLQGVRALGGSRGVLLEPTVRLTMLDLSENELRSDAAQIIGSALQSNQTLRSLKMSYNPIGSGIKALAAGLKSNTTLTGLDLSGCDIGTDHARFLAQILQTNRTLTELRLSQNQLGNDGVEEVAAALCENCSLRALGLRETDLEDQGIKALARALVSNQTLTELVLTENLIGASGYQHLAQVMEGNISLTSLSLPREPIRGEDSRLHQDRLRVQSFLQRNRRPPLLLHLLHVEQEGSSTKVALMCAESDPFVIEVPKGATLKQLQLAAPPPEPDRPCVLRFQLPNGRLFDSNMTVEMAFRAATS